MTVRIRCIDSWEEFWVDMHRDHYDASEPLYWQRFAYYLSDDSSAEDCSDNYDAEVDEEAPSYLLKCCGMKRPRAKDVKLEVKTSGAFLTVHEFVSAVHPWLMSLRERLLDSLARLDGWNMPWPSEYRLAVLYFGNGPLHIDDERKWADSRRKPFVPPPGYVRPTAEERSRRRIEMTKAMAAAKMQEREAAAARARERENTE